MTRQRIVRFPSGYSHSAFRPQNDSKVPFRSKRLFDGKAHGQVGGDVVLAQSLRSLLDLEA